MKKLLWWLLLPVFLAPLPTISSDQEIVLTSQEQFALAHGGTFSATSYETLPQNPRLYADTLAYKDKNLTVIDKTLSAKDAPKLKAIHINDNLLPVFELKDGSFMHASQLLLFDDVESYRKPLEKKLWLGPEVTVFDKPYVIGAKKKDTDLKAYQEVTIKQEAKTYSGLYYEIDKKGWVLADDLNTDADRIEEVQSLLESKYKKNNLSIYVERIKTGQVAQVNSDKVMYAASVVKLATLYYVQNQVTAGTVKLDDNLKYIKAVNEFKGHYDTAGAGAISKEADDKDYKVEDLLKALAQSSDNAASNILSYHLTGQFDQAFQDQLTATLGEPFDVFKRQISAKQAAKMMLALYEQNGQVLDYLSDTDFDDTRISKDIEVRVAHKTGDAYDFKHDVAIVYATEPFVLSIFTEKASHEDITTIANDVYKILK